MGLYEFHNLDINERGDPPFIPPEALFILSDGVGTPIEDLIDGYQTLNVSGRELSAYELNTQSIDNEDGAMYLGATRPTREIEVTYQLVADDDVEFRAKYQRLNYYLSNKQFDFFFYDDDQYQWTGTVTSSDKPDAGRNIVKSTFIITCTDPFKRLRTPVAYSNSGGVLRIAEPAYYETTPDLISLRLKANTTAVRVSNGRQVISLTGNFHANDTINIKISEDVDRDSQILLNGANHLELLDLASDFENFKLKIDDNVTVSPDADMTVQLRRREL